MLELILNHIKVFVIVGNIMLWSIIAYLFFSGFRNVTGKVAEAVENLDLSYKNNYSAIIKAINNNSLGYKRKNGVFWSMFGVHTTGLVGTYWGDAFFRTHKHYKRHEAGSYKSYKLDDVILAYDLFNEVARKHRVELNVVFPTTGKAYYCPMLVDIIDSGKEVLYIRNSSEVASMLPEEYILGRYKDSLRMMNNNMLIVKLDDYSKSLLKIVGAYNEQVLSDTFLAYFRTKSTTLRNRRWIWRFLPRR